MFAKHECEVHRYSSEDEECPDCATPKAFQTWTFNGVRFLSFPFDHSSFSICDENGNQYGSWMDVQTFRKRQQTGDETGRTPLGKVRLQFQHIIAPL